MSETTVASGGTGHWYDLRRHWRGTARGLGTGLGFYCLLYFSIVLHHDVRLIAGATHSSAPPPAALFGLTDGWLLIIFGATALWVTYASAKHWLEHRGETTKNQKSRGFQLWLYLIVGFVASHLTMAEFLSGVRGEGVVWSLVIVCLAIWIVAVRRVRSLYADFLPRLAVRSFRRADAGQNRKLLVLFLSPPRCRNVQPVNELGLPLDPPATALTIDGWLEWIADAERKWPNLQWPWEVALRAIRPHLDSLDTIVVLPSNATMANLPAFAKLLSLTLKASDCRVVAALMRNDAEFARSGIELVPLLADGVPNSHLDDRLELCHGVNFEDFAAMSECLHGAIERMKIWAPEAATDGAIVVDVTSGQKPNSIVGASLSFGRDIVMQYVQTGDPKEAIIYDLELAKPAGLSH